MGLGPDGHLPITSDQVLQPSDTASGFPIWRLGPPKGRSLLVTKEGKLATNWEGPYQVEEVHPGAYRIQHLNGTLIVRIWNVDNLKVYY